MDEIDPEIEEGIEEEGQSRTRKKGYSWPRVNDPDNMKFNCLRALGGARLLISDGEVILITDVKGIVIDCPDEMTAHKGALTSLAERFSWDLSGDKTLHLRTMRLVEGHEPFYERISHDDVKDRDLMRARKTAKVYARLIEDDGEVITTMADGHRETSRMSSAGEVLLRNPAGEEYAIGMQKFIERYGEYDGEREYAPKGVEVSFVYTSRPVVLTPSWGGDMFVKAGGAVIIEDDESIYGIQPDEFRDTYEVID